MRSINDILRNEEYRQEEEKESQSLEEKIMSLDHELLEYDDYRKKINKLKKEKDSLVLEYIQSIKQPTCLDVSMINYKALYFYFKKEFIEAKKTLDFNYYYNGIKNKIRSDVFSGKFGEDKKILISIKGTNFPHLIGYKVDREEGLNLDSMQNRDFLNHIYYETNLIENYKEHGCDISKIKCISWIWDTLRSPYMVFDQDGLNKNHTKVETDLCFVKGIKNEDGEYLYHYVSLKKINGNSDKNKYVINSHHKLTNKEFNDKFFLNKAIYKFDYNVKKAKKKGN